MKLHLWIKASSKQLNVNVESQAPLQTWLPASPVIFKSSTSRHRRISQAEHISSCKHRLLRSAYKIHYCESIIAFNFRLFVRSVKKIVVITIGIITSFACVEANLQLFSQTEIKGAILVSALFRASLRCRFSEVHMSSLV